MRVETINGRHLLCGHILPDSQVRHGQEWAPADGKDYVAKINAVRDGWVCYTQVHNGQRVYHEKEVFAFQSRYCLVLPTNEIPEELL